MAVTENLKSLVNQFPVPISGRLLDPDLDKEKMEKIAATIAEGGKKNILGLIEMLDTPGSQKNVKPHFLLHCVVNHALIAGNEKMRKEFCEAMASQLGNKNLLPYNRAYLCQELQWAGRDEACPALGKMLLDQDLTDDAATALAAIGGERAASQLRGALIKAKGKARLNLIDALAALVDSKSAGIFKKALHDKDREVRIAAAIGLAYLGQEDSAEPLFKAIDSAKGWEKFQITKTNLVLAEKLVEAGKKSIAKRIYERLLKTKTDDSEQFIHEAAQLGLAAIA
jgi:hypothetical protein